ncbi:MAG: MFS transporter [candidate division Zixibacteria bacterium]
MALGINKVSIKTITFSAIVMWVGFYAWRIMFNNFAVEVFDASPTDVGVIQAVREIPGLLAFGAGALAVYFTESKIASLALIAMGLGLLFCGFSPTLVVLGLATVMMSFGFHYFEPVNSSQLLALSDTNEVGKVQGRLLSYESMAGLLGAGMILLMTLFIDFRVSFIIFGSAVILIGLYLVLALPPNRGKQEKRKVRIRRKYWLYYSLSFLRGCRRHIFTTFAIFLLVKNHNLDITVVSIIMLANNFITIFTNRYLGVLNDRYGEKFVLVGCSFFLIFIFCGYAFVSLLPMLIALYVIDNILFGSSIALKSYIRKISTEEDLTGCLSFGMTSNHITAVVIPIAGGVMWSMFGYQVTFLAGALIVLIDLLLALKVPGKNILSPDSK